MAKYLVKSSQSMLKRFLSVPLIRKEDFWVSLAKAKWSMILLEITEKFI